MANLSASLPITRSLATPDPQIAGVVAGAPNLLLRLEGALVLVGATAAYAQLGQGWLLYALLFLAPDLAMLGYLAGNRIGARLYNLGHTYLLPAALIGLGLAAAQPLATAIGVIWVAHIGIDRLLGYGLKYETAFGHSHLGAARR